MRLASLKRSVSLGLRLFEFLKPHLRVFLLSILALGVAGATEPLMPWLLKYLFNEGFETTAAPRPLVVWLIPVFLLSVFVLRGAMSYVGTVAAHWVSQRMVMDLRQTMFGNLITLPAPFYDAHAGGEIIAKFSFDVTQLSAALTRGLEVLIKDSVAVVALTVFLILLDPLLAAILVLTTPAVAFIVYRFGQRMRETSTRLQNSIGEIGHVTEEAIAGNREVKIFGGHQYEMARFERAANAARKNEMKVIRSAAASAPIIQLIMAAGLAVMIYFGLNAAADGAIQTGSFVAFVTAVVLLLPPIKRLSSINEFLQRGFAAAESVFALIDHPHEATGGLHYPGKLRGELTFSGVRFCYPGAGRPALDDVNLTVPAGRTVALVGPSGAGKSTLVGLVPRFYEPTSGAILLDGHDIADFSVYWLRQQIAMVSQRAVLFDDTLYNNIAYGAMREAPRARVMNAAEAAHVLEFAERLPEGLDTVIGTDGVRLSGGQRQRIAIARALLKDAPILILDEATSAVDNDTERLIQEALAKLRAGRTSLIVAHRLSTVESADLIVVVENGRIVQSGTHAELSRCAGPYTRLYHQHIGAAPEGVDLTTV